MKKMKIKEAIYLIKDCGLTICKVAKRLKLKRGTVMRIKNDPSNDPDRFIQKKTLVPKFQKLHQRARNVIAEKLNSS